MFGSNFRDFVSQDTTSHGQSNPERLIKNWHGFEKPDSEDSSIEEEFEILESKNQGGAKGRHHSGDSGIEGEEESEISGDRSQPEDKLQCSSFENGYETIEVSDLDKIQIAGFSKQKLLEMCNFCKISYGNNDEKLDSRYKTKAELINESYVIIPFYYKKNRTFAGFVFTKDKEITIVYRGTKGLDDVMTDVSAAFTQGFLPESGKMHSGFCDAFYDSLPSLSTILGRYAEEKRSEIKDFEINCTGHSMGAALATITALYLKKVEDAEYVRVATFGSPRVFNFHGAEIYEKLLGENTIRVTNLSDPIPMFPTGSMGFKHVGEPLKIKTGNLIVNCLVTDLHIVGKYYHKTDTYYNCIQDIKPEDFQPDNNVSRYYYFSYVVAAPYCITTTILTTPYYLFLSAISNTEQRCFEREMKFADNQRLISLKDNKSGLVLGNAMVSLENPLIISHIECNFNERGEGLKFNIDDIASFVNSNYHLNRNNMRLRQLCEIKDVPNLIDAENYAPGGRNTVSGLVNEPATPGQVIDEAGSKHSQGPKPKSTDSHTGVESDEKKQAPVQPTEHVPEERVGLKAQPSNTQEQQEVPETPVLGQMDDTESLSTQDDLVFQSDSTTVLSIDGDEKERVPVQPVESESKGDQQDSPPLSPQSSVSGDECSSGPLSFTKLPKSDEGDTDNNNDKYVKVSPENMTKEDLTPKGSGSLQGIQPEISVPSPSTFPNVNGAPTIEGHMVIMEDIEDSKVSSIVSEDSLIEDVTDEPEKTNKEDSTLKSSNNTKSSKLPIVDASALAVTGIVSGVAVAVYLEMLAVGIAVGACCLVAAAIIYYCTPKSQVENSEVEKPFNTREVPTAVPV